MDVDTANGLILCDRLIPEMLLSDLMLHYFDANTLKECQMVCKRWNGLLKDYVWRRRAQLRAATNKLSHESITWFDCRRIVVENLFNRNLIENHSGKHRFTYPWMDLRHGGHGWQIECPPAGMPFLPIEDGFDEQRCFVTSHGMCAKKYLLNFVDEGFSPDILDHLQPPIEFSELYGCRFDCRGNYFIRVELLNQYFSPIMKGEFMDIMKNDRMNTWHKFKRTFRNYGRGVRYIEILHFGKSAEYRAGYYGTKMARACVKFLPFDVDNGPDIPAKQSAYELQVASKAIDLHVGNNFGQAPQNNFSLFVDLGVHEIFDDSENED